MGPASSPSPDQQTPMVAKDILIVLTVIVVVLALVALYANVSRTRRDKVETVIVTPIATPSPSAKAP
jgi:hypothetical protein